MMYDVNTINQTSRITDHPPYRLRQWILNKSIRYIMAGNRYLISLKWLEEDLQKMAEESMSEFEGTGQVGTLRQVRI